MVTPWHKGADPYGLYDMQFDDEFVTTVYAQERARAVYRAFLTLKEAGCRNPQATLAEGMGISRSRAGQLVKRGEHFYKIMASGRKLRMERYLCFSRLD
jgi:hypothetical protein